MRNLLLSSLGLLAFACASHPAPTEQIASSLAAVRGAEEAGALQVPEAALHVKLAEEQIEKAQALMSDDENQRAEDLAIRAYQDAELAIALARENMARQRLEQFAEANRTAGGEQSGAMQGTGSQGTSTPASEQVQPSGMETAPASGTTVTD